MKKLYQTLEMECSCEREIRASDYMVQKSPMFAEGLYTCACGTRYFIHIQEIKPLDLKK